MASTIPAHLKSADIARYAHRGGQLEKAKPAIAYYCYYWIIDQIIAKGLHKSDSDSMAYTTNLMDKLEQMKADYAENDAIIDDVAGHAYVEQFALETFQRAENAMKANRVTRQTADTFQASATFLELGQIWGPLEAETTSKIKFAKYHALRIAKAIKAGDDPNLSNPVTEPPPTMEPPLDPNDPEVQMINGTSDPSSAARQPSVEEVPDESDPVMHHLSPPSAQEKAQNVLAPDSKSASQSQGQSVVVPSPAQGEEFYTDTAHADVSPLAPPSTDRKSSLGGGYFPAVPDSEKDPVSTSGISPIENVSPPVPPNPPQSFQPSVPDPHVNTGFAPEPSPSSLHSFPPIDTKPTSISGVAPSASQNRPFVPAQASFPSQPSVSASFVPTGPPKTVAPVKRPDIVAPVPAVAPNDAILNTDEESIMAAQKHARWAISALNFEDVNTAVKELRGALESLGAV